VSDGLIAISAATLRPDFAVGLDLYVRPKESGRPILFRASHQPLTAEDIERLTTSGVSKLYIDRGGREAYQTYLREQLSQWLGDASMPVEARAAALNEVVRDVLSESFNEGDTDQIVSSVQEIGRQTAAFLNRETIAVSDLFRVMHHDYATFTHSANVAYYATLLAKALGFSAAEQEQITVGGLLHDIGKLEIDDRILTKPGKLDELEFRQIRKHPGRGMQQLARRADLCWGQLMMVYQHHERVDGTGYPSSIPDAEIHPWAKVCAVVDVFEALTAQRPYRQPLSHATAIEILQRDVGKAFDPEMVRCWQGLVQKRSGN
jgi:putative nucleotidyltransferase with HDIG domain